MPALTNYNQFEGLHWETGSVRNFLDYIGVRAPHTGAPYSEALLLGVSGGVVMGYFSFAYEGYPPMCNILTRNTFDPFDSMLSRLGVMQHLKQTTNPEKGIKNLYAVIEEGQPAIVWADMFSMPYEARDFDAGMWAMFPILVYGYDQVSDVAQIADRARVPLVITTAELDAARSRVKKDKFRILTLDPPNPDKLPAAVQKGIWDTIKLYTEPPPKGTRNNFGLQAFRYWQELLTKPKMRLSWEREFPGGPKMFAGQLSAFEQINTFGKNGSAERDVYADFLVEASQILGRAGLREAADLFRASASGWHQLSLAILPDEIEIFGKTRRLILERHGLFLEFGREKEADRMRKNAELAEIRQRMEVSFPLSQPEVVKFRENLAEHVKLVANLESLAVTSLQDAME